MSDAFWAGLFVALPAMFAALLAYWKSEIAVRKAEQNGHTVNALEKRIRAQPTADELSNVELTRLYRLMLEEVKRLEQRIDLRDEDPDGKQIVDN